MEKSNRENEKVSEKIEKKELVKKYYSHKKELRTKLAEINKSLVENFKEVEEDYEHVLKTEPELLSEKEKDGFKKYLETEKTKIKLEIETLQAHENELEFNYNDLKTEPKVDMLIEYAKTVNHAIGINAPLMKMAFDYFNFLNDSKENQEKSKIKIDCFTDDKGLFIDSFPNNTNMEYYSGNVIIDFKDIIRIVVTLKKYYEQGKGFVHKLCFFSEGKTYLNPDYLAKKVLFNSISHSKIKGSYITMGANSITWRQEKLEKRSFSDIFLPKSIMEDLRLYTALNDKTGKLLRYLMIGSPGTGKTESTLAIANYLKDKGVTIIKTMVCESLKEKIELAELLAPSLVIFDDIDLSLGSRKKGMVSGGLAQFLDVLDGTEKIRQDVGIIATTNSLELLDMAAQRPGRFDKLLSFDSLTKSNIRNIILKSLKYNFEMEADNLEVVPFIAYDVVDKLHDSRVTGAHVYNTIKMLYLRIQTLELTDITSQWVVKEITLELDTLKRIRRTDYLNEKMAENGSGNIGFATMKNEDEDIVEECVEELQFSEMNMSAKEQDRTSDYKYRDGRSSPVSSENQLEEFRAEETQTERTL